MEDGWEGLLGIICALNGVSALPMIICQCKILGDLALVSFGAPLAGRLEGIPGASLLRAEWRWHGCSLACIGVCHWVAHGIAGVQQLPQVDDQRGAWGPLGILLGYFFRWCCFP